jgi:hypothetical protein
MCLLPLDPLAGFWLIRSSEQGNRVKEQTPNPILQLDHLGLA